MTAASSTMMHTGRISGLEVLRGYAALSVVIFHVEAVFFELPAGTLKSTIRLFHYAVPLFFALSAFSLLYGYSSRLFDEASLKRFYVRRFFRIVPLFYVMLFIYLIHRRLTGVPTELSEIVINLTFLFPFLPDKSASLVWAGWSLGIEWLFYIAFPFFALVARNTRVSVALFLVCAVVTMAMAAVSGPYDGLQRITSTLRNLIYFQAGVVTFALAQNTRAGRLLMATIPRYSAWLIVLSLLLLVAARTMTGPRAAFDVLFAFACGVWIACAFAGLPKAIDNVVSRFLGRISYGIYLTHPLVLVLLKLANVYEGVGNYIGEVYLAYAVNCLLTVGCTLVLATLAYRFVESPGIGFGERLIGRRPPAAFAPQTPREAAIHSAPP